MGIIVRLWPKQEVGLLGKAVFNSVTVNFAVFNKEKMDKKDTKSWETNEETMNWTWADDNQTFVLKFGLSRNLQKQRNKNDDKLEKMKSVGATKNN